MHSEVIHDTSAIFKERLLKNRYIMIIKLKNRAYIYPSIIVSVPLVTTSKAWREIVEVIGTTDRLKDGRGTGAVPIAGRKGGASGVW